MLDKWIRALEGSGIPAYLFVLEVLILGAVRIIAESRLFNYDYSYISYVHAVAYYFCITGFVLMVVKIVTGERIRKIMRAFSWFIPVHLLLPYIDKYVFGRDIGTQYPGASTWASVALSFFESNPSIAHRGHQVVFLIILALLFVYIYSKMRETLRGGVVRPAFMAFLTVFFIHVGIIAISTPDIWPTYNFLYAFNRTLPEYGHWTLFINFTFLGLIFWFIPCVLESRDVCISLMRDISIPRVTHFSLMALLGLKISGHIFSWDVIHRVDVLSSITAILAVVFGWGFVVGFNNYCDAEHDARTNPHRGIPSGLYCPRTLFDFSLTCLVLGGFLALAAGPLSFAFYLIFVSLGFAYSYPSLRVREMGFKNIVIGLGSALCFAIGYFAYAYSPSPQGDFTALFLLITVIFALGSTVNDLKDMEADRARGIKTVFTLLGRRRGKAVAAAMIFVAFMLPSLVIPPWAYLFLIPALAGAAGMWLERRAIVYLSYFAEYGLIFYLL